MMIAKQVLRRALLGAVVACTLVAGAAQAVTFNVDNVNLQYGFMNVFELPSNGGGYIFGSGWGIGDLNASWGGSSWTFTPNTIGDPNPFWYTPSGGPGAAGNKDMDANLYAQFDGTYAGQTLTFIGSVSENSLVAPYACYVYIRDFAPDFSSVIETRIPMPAAGNFSVSQALINDPARHAQFGVGMRGPCVWSTDIAQKGKVVFGPQQVVPTQKTSWGRLKQLMAR